MLRVALTGGVGSGKSAAAAMLRNLGALVSQSDEVGRRLMEPDGPAFHAIVFHFGSGIVSANGSLDRQALAGLAFAGGRLEELNALVHPLVIAEQQRWFEEVASASPNAVAVVESALVFETRHAPADADSTPWRTRFDRIIVVSADLALRRERYVRRTAGAYSDADKQRAARADFDRRAAAQWTDEKKVALSDYVLRNDGSLDDLQHQVNRLWPRLQQESVDRSAEAM